MERELRIQTAPTTVSTVRNGNPAGSVVEIRLWNSWRSHADAKVLERISQEFLLAISLVAMVGAVLIICSAAGVRFFS
jgi:hypothetical protein